MKENKPDGILIPGLGADERVFKEYLSTYNCVIFNWVEPKEGETIEEYVRRWLKGRLYSPKFILGVSFGGIIADQLKLFFPEAKLVLVSSFYTQNQQKTWLRYIIPLITRRVFNLSKSRVFNPITCYVFGVELEKEKILLHNIVAETEYSFFKWAIKQIGSWKETKSRADLIIHGNNDRIIKVGKVNGVKIMVGGHFIILQRHKEIKSLIQKMLI